eukprot:97060-Ditylum_brightwellii.AAC.1
MAYFFFGHTPRTEAYIESCFNVCKKYCGGKHLWKWIYKIQAMKEEKIIWEEELDDPDAETFIASLD